MAIRVNFNFRISAWADEPKMQRKNRGICGAMTRKGTPCQAPPVWDKMADKAKNGRCKLHGGMSTGARTEAGREAIRASNRCLPKMMHSKTGKLLISYKISRLYFFKRTSTSTVSV